MSSLSQKRQKEGRSQSAPVQPSNQHTRHKRQKRQKQDLRQKAEHQRERQREHYLINKEIIDLLKNNFNPTKLDCDVLSNGDRKITYLQRGKDGEVYSVVPNNDAEEYAVKRINLMLNSGNFTIKHDFIIKKTIKEIKFLKTLKDSSPIIDFKEALYAENTYKYLYIKTELCNGGDLFDYINNHAMNENKVKDWTRQILDAIKSCHDNQIAHIDIKPENLVLKNENTLKLIDFGLAEKFDDMCGLQVATGTPSYWAPEVCLISPKYNVSPKYNEKVDIWSAGATVCALLGLFPVNPPTVFNILLLENNKDTTHVSAEGFVFLKKLLVTIPSKRPDIDTSIEYFSNWSQINNENNVENFSRQVKQRILNLKKDRLAFQLSRLRF